MKYIYLLFFLVLASCTSLKKNTTIKTTEETNIPVTAKIIFLNYNVSKSINNTVEFSLINKIITEGSLKKNRQKETTKNAGDLICIQQDVNLVAIDSFHIENPLIKNIEYADPSGKLSRKTIELDNATVSVRMDLKSETKFITLKLLNNTNNSLLKIQL